MINRKFGNQAPHRFDALGRLGGFQLAEYVVKVHLVVADGEFRVQLGVVALVAFDRNLRKEGDAAVEICDARIVVQLSIYDLVLDDHYELIDL